MFNTIEREELIKKYATNQFEEDYINGLGDEVFEQMAEVIESMEEWGDEVTFQDIMIQASVPCMLTYDYETANIIERRFPNVDYVMLQLKASGSEDSIHMDDEGRVTFELNMKPEQHMIMTLLETLEGLEEYILEQGVADQCIIKNTIGVNE